MIMAVVAVVGAPLAFFVIREAARDPIFAELDSWTVPQWAATKHRDDAYGSRWCIRECRFRERTWQSSKIADETNLVYVAALKDRRWIRWRETTCPGGSIQGHYSCWRRDEYVLDLWVRDEVCEIKPVRPTVAPHASGAPAAADAEPGGIPGPGCGKSQVTVKVYNRVAYQRGI